MTTLREFDRTEFERLRRMKACFDVDQPERSEMVRVVQRWQLAKSRRVSAHRLRLAWATAIFMMLGGVAMAASGLSGLPDWSWLGVSSRKAPPTPAHTERVKRYVVERNGKRVEHSAAAELKLSPGEQATLIVEGARTELTGPGVVRVQAAPASVGWVAHFEPQGWAPEVPADQPSPNGAMPQPIENLSVVNHSSARDASRAPVSMHPTGSSPSVISVAESSSSSIALTNVPQLSSAWARAAAAMRQGNEANALSALDEIGRSADPANRDAAMLAKAQLELAAGRSETAMAVVRELAQSGATPFIRQRASEIVARGN